MKKLFLTAAAGAVAMALCGTANAANLDSINQGLKDGLPNAWFFNFTDRTDHHQALDGFGGNLLTNTSGNTATGKDVKADPTAGLFYENPIVNGAGTSTVGVHIQGFKGFSISGGTVSREDSDELDVVVHDFVGGSNHNGIGVMSSPEEGTPPASNLEQVNVGDEGDTGEFLVLTFTETINLLGLDFSNGDHNICGSGRACGGVNIYTGTGGLAGTFALAHTIAANMADATNLSSLGLVADTFILEAIGPTVGNGEEGWYLSAIAGDTTAVPLPASILFMIAGLAGLGALKMRRTA